MEQSYFPYRHLNVLIMPTDFCNMNCVYCFNSHRAAVRDTHISFETLKRTYEIIFPFYSDIRFIWHGGEPLSMGVDFYREALNLQNEANTNHIKVSNSIQTNLTLLDKCMAAFLIENGIQVSSSFDGSANEKTRHNTNRILDGYETLKKAGGRCGFICVITKHNINHLIDDYQKFNEHGIGYQLNTYLTSPPYDKDPLFVPADVYVRRICEFFDYWMYDTSCKIAVSYFEHYLNHLFLKEKHICSFNSCMGKFIGIRYNGDICACNRDFPEQYTFGNVHDYNDIRDCFSSPGFKALLSNAISRRHDCQSKCPIYDLCTGGCNHISMLGGDVSKQNTYFCDTRIPVYKHIMARVEPWLDYPYEASLEDLNPYLKKCIMDRDARYKDI